MKTLSHEMRCMLASILLNFKSHSHLSFYLSVHINLCLPIFVPSVCSLLFMFNNFLLFVIEYNEMTSSVSSSSSRFWSKGFPSVHLSPDSNSHLTNELFKNGKNFILTFKCFRRLFYAASFHTFYSLKIYFPFLCEHLMVNFKLKSFLIILKIILILNMLCSLC